MTVAYKNIKERISPIECYQIVLLIWIVKTFLRPFGTLEYLYYLFFAILLVARYENEHYAPDMKDMFFAAFDV